MTLLGSITSDYKGSHHPSVIQTQEVLPKIYGRGDMRPDPLFQTKLCDFLFPILDLSQN